MMGPQFEIKVKGSGQECPLHTNKIKVPALFPQRTGKQGRGTRTKTKVKSVGQSLP
jgi:hypothetical protein